MNKNIKRQLELLLFTSTFVIGLFLKPVYDGVKSAWVLDESLEDDLLEYNANIENYANDVRKLNLTKFEIVMKVMMDFLADTKGYGTPTVDPTNFYRLAYKDENGVGVCRNIADNYTAILNAIDTSFEAIDVTVYMGDESAQYCNIKRKVVTQECNNEENMANDDKNEVETSKVSFNERYIVGNHMITLAKISEDNVYLLIDPTNCTINILDNAQIKKLSNNEKITENITIGGLSVTDTSSEFFSSMYNSFFSEDDINYLEKKYGLEAQNKIIEKLEQEKYPGMVRIKQLKK